MTLELAQCTASTNGKLNRSDSYLWGNTLQLHRSAIGPEQVSDTAPPIVPDVLRSPGKPLDAETRAFLEPRFGHDFSNVRVHADDKAAESARAVSARAYTVGNHVAFNTGQYRPSSDEGIRLIAHELAHTVQQDTLVGTSPVQSFEIPIAGRESSSEREAGQVSERIFSGPVDVHATERPGTIQRAAPAAAAPAGVALMLKKCAVGAIIGVLLDYAVQAGMHMWRRGTGRFWEMTVDVCSLVLSAVLSCIGGAVSVRWLTPWLDEALGPRLAGLGGPLVGRILLFLANKASVGIPKGVLKKLMHFGCVSPEQAEMIEPGVSAELDESPGSEQATDFAEPQDDLAA